MTRIALIFCLFSLHGLVFVSEACGQEKFRPRSIEKLSEKRVEKRAIETAGALSKKNERSWTEPQTAFERAVLRETKARPAEFAKSGRDIWKESHVDVAGTENVRLLFSENQRTGQRRGFRFESIKPVERQFLSVDQFRSLPETGKVDPMAIRFSQDSISNSFKNGKRLDEVISQIRTGELDPIQLPPIRIVEYQSKVFSLDNRRLFVFQELRIPVKYERLTVIPPSEMPKFTNANEGVSITVRNWEARNGR